MSNTETYQTPEQKARVNIDALLEQAGWRVQHKKNIDLSAGLGIVVREYDTDAGPADYVLFIDRKAVGVIEAKPEEWGQKITTVEEQSGGYAVAKLKWVNNRQPLRFVYESTGIVTRFTDGRDPKPRSREVFNFPRPDTMQEWLSKPASLRARLRTMPPLNYAGLRDCQIVAIENLEDSFRDDRPRALIQMATGSGKTYTAIRRSHPFTACSNMPTPSASSSWSIRRISGSRPSRNSWPTCQTTITGNSLSFTTSSA